LGQIFAPATHPLTFAEEAVGSLGAAGEDCR
jgi:hypothetical protein